MAERPGSAAPQAPPTDSPGAGFLTTPRKAFFSTVTLGLGGIECIVAVFLLEYYTDDTGLAIEWAGLALLLGKVFDAVSDPVMEYISDHYKTPWGRRRPWFFVGARLFP